MMKRYLYIMFVCACALFVFVGNAAAQIKDGDVVTIRNGNNYLGVNNKANAIENITDLSTAKTRALWTVEISGNAYSFVSVVNDQKELRGNNNNTLSLNATGSSFTFNGTNANGGYVAKGTLAYNNRYIRYNKGWKLDNTTSTSLTIEKWELKSEKGEVKITATANPSTITFDEFVDDDTAESKDITVTVSSASTKEKEYYQNLNNSLQTILVSEKDVVGDSFEISGVSATWSSNSNNSIYSSTNCEVFGESASTRHNLLKIESVTPGADNKSCTISISTVGNSPMEMKEGEKWKDYSDILVVAFRNADPNIDATYRAYIDVTRHSFHQEELPEFEVTSDYESYTFKKGEDTLLLDLTCIHQHGKDIYHMKYDHDELTPYLKETIYDRPREEIKDLSFASFEVKSVIDETIVDWVTTRTTNLENGKLTLKTIANGTGIVREARLVGVFNDTCSTTPLVTHTAFLEIPLSQNAKEGQIKFYHQKGHYNTEFGKNPHTLEDEQLVHTAERTIYYLPNDEITLTLPEVSFQGYKRWYDYETQDDPRYNAIKSDRTKWKTPPLGDLINSTEGDTYGIYDDDQREANVPVIYGWANGAAHTIACDVSNYKDHTITRDEGGQITSITEPTLSYRQLFHLRPASEIADSLTARSLRGEYFEVHSYMAPTNTDIYLASDFHHSLNLTSDNCYFYYNASGDIVRVNKNVAWSTSNASSTVNTNYTVKDYGIVSYSQEDTITYDLRVPGVLADGKDLLIARFVVTYVSPNSYGPSTTELIRRQDILNEYIILEEINFNYEPLPDNDDNQQLYRPLPWGESTYGYYYPNGELGGNDKYYRHNNRSQHNIPFTGEYMLVNGLDIEWADQMNRGGYDQGYAIYVDGSEEPGLVASISTDATICSGQTMYCSMWLCNPSRDRGNEDAYSHPVFRCNIQGRKKVGGEYTDWEDVGVYFVGELSWGPNDKTGGSWNHVNFPIMSKRDDYDETRVSIYNFGTGEGGNDFMVDDICLYVSPLPLAAYHATTGCEAYTHDETTNTVMVLRIDYDQLKKDQRGRPVYYEIYNETDAVTIELKEKVDGVYRPIYLAEDTSNVSTRYGSINIPANLDGVTLENSITGFINNLVSITNDRKTVSASGKCFIKDAITNKHFLYVVHVIPTANNVTGEDTNVYLDRDKSYILRIAYNHTELHEANCVFTTQMHATQDTYVQLRNEDVDSLRITSCLNDLCANNHHFLDVKVQNTITPTAGGALQMIEAKVHADWLVGFKFDDIYCDETSIDSLKQALADSAFVREYGYTRLAIEDAIAAMRNTSDDNLNREVSNAKDLELIPGIFTDSNRIIIRALCNRGLLSLYQETEMFYLGSLDTARYWVYPVAKDVEVTVGSTTYTLTDCNEPKWVCLSSAYSEYAVNLSPINKEDQTLQQRLDLPSIRLLEGTERVVIPIQQLTDSTKIYTYLSTLRDSISFRYDSPIEHVLEYVDLSNNRIDIVDAPSKLEAGEEYLMRMAFYDQDGNAYIRGNEDSCRVGYIYFYLTIVPRTVQWTGEASRIWGDDGNWRGVKDGTLMDIGYAPLPESNVIIKKLNDVLKPYPVVMTDDHYPMDVYHHPNACNKIYIEHGAMIHNQHLLKYNQAFVDMKISAANWNSMAPPLKGMYTGDMFVPYNVTTGKDAEYRSVSDHSEYPFVVSPFKGTRTSKAPYVFWQSLYNKRATIYHYNGNQSHPALTESAIFAQTNSLNQPLPVGSGYQVLGFGPTHGTEDEIIVRLPKPDTYYDYYYSNGTVSDQRANVSEHTSRLGFEPDSSGNMTITLTNDLESTRFMFGNPTMTKIDMQKFLQANSSLLANKYYTMDGSSWNAKNMFTIENSWDDDEGLLAPMRSVMLELKEDASARKSISLTLSASHLEGYMNPVQTIPARKMAAEESGETQLMTIYATSEGGQARCMLATNAYAHDIYSSEEDALFISSGVEEGVNSATATSPVNMYTVSEQVPMMVDVREKIDTVPLSMLVHDSYRTEKVQFSFYLSLNWDKECYFCDAVTGERYRILDGLVLEMDMPQNHEVRYFIDGPDVIDPDNGGDIWSSTEDVKTSNNQVWAYSPSQGQLVVASNDIIKAVMVYDIAGRLIGYRELEMQYNSTTFDTPTGACIVKAVLRDNTEHYISALVK